MYRSRHLRRKASADCLTASETTRQTGTLGSHRDEAVIPGDCTLEVGGNTGKTSLPHLPEATISRGQGFSCLGKGKGPLVAASVDPTSLSKGGPWCGAAPWWQAQQTHDQPGPHLCLGSPGLTSEELRIPQEECAV